jgi:hypothetical protein
MSGLTLLAAAPLPAAGPSAPLFENSDFRSGTLGNWTAEGAAFEGKPTDKQVTPDSDTTNSIVKDLVNHWNASRNLYLQPELTGCDARLFANSFHPESLNRATGTLTSIPFPIRHDYLTFQLAGGRAACPGILAVNLLADDAVVRQALPRGEQFVCCSFKLWQGKDITLTMTGWSAAADPLAGAVLDDRIRGLDNLYDEPNRPQFHFTPPQGWINDPNGLVYYDGEYHLFYQHDPSRSGIIGRNMHWGHAVSTDFFHWNHLPIALGVDPERGQNYSGSAIIDHRNAAGFQQGDEKTLIAFHTRVMAHMYHEFDFDVDSSDQCMAYSTDRGRTWTHLGKPAVAGITALNRDPKVFFHKESNKWIMAFFIRGGYDFYASDNLRNWTRLSHAKGFHECPDVFQLALDGNPDKRQWLVVNGNGEYAIGDFDGREFTEKSRSRTIFDLFHATQTFANAPDDPLRRVQMNWLRYDLRDLPCRQMLSLPV